MLTKKDNNFTKTGFSKAGFGCCGHWTQCNMGKKDCFYEDTDPKAKHLCGCYMRHHKTLNFKVNKEPEVHNSSLFQWDLFNQIDGDMIDNIFQQIENTKYLERKEFEIKSNPEKAGDKKQRALEKLKNMSFKDIIEETLKSWVKEYDQKRINERLEIGDKEGAYEYFFEKVIRISGGHCSIASYLCNYVTKIITITTEDNKAFQLTSEELWKEYLELYEKEFEFNLFNF